MWTDALEPGWRPAASPFMTAVILLEPHGSGTKYMAIALHKDEASRERHEAMGSTRAGAGPSINSSST